MSCDCLNILCTMLPIFELIELQSYERSKRPPNLIPCPRWKYSHISPLGITHIIQAINLGLCVCHNPITVLPPAAGGSSVGQPESIGVSFLICHKRGSVYMPLRLPARQFGCNLDQLNVDYSESKVTLVPEMQCQELSQC